MHRYFILYKPYGYLSQFTGEEGDLTLQDLVKQNQIVDFPKDVYTVGRLDKDSEGILLLTNDNRLKTKLLDPNSKSKKTYHVQVEGAISDADLEPIRAGGIVIQHEKRDHRCLPAQARMLKSVDYLERNPPIRFRKDIPTSWIEIKLIEGKNRQIRKMTAAIGFPTLRLIRDNMDGFSIDELSLGELKEIDY
jgi:23S rRNA pseudouridine2457 synthase